MLQVLCQCGAQVQIPHLTALTVFAASVPRTRGNTGRHMSALDGLAGRQCMSTAPTCQHASYRVRQNRPLTPS